MESIVDRHLKDYGEQAREAAGGGERGRGGEGSQWRRKRAKRKG